MFLEINVMHEFGLAFLYTVAFGLMFFASEVIYSKLKVDAELTRKFIHITCGTIAMTVPLTHPHVYTIIILGLFFSALTYFMLRKGLLPSVHAVKRHSFGSVIFPIGVIACVIFGLRDDYKIYFFVPIATMIYSDTIAALTGINFPVKQFKILGFTKSLGGSLGFFISSFLICIVVCRYFLETNSLGSLFLCSVLYAAVTTAIETISVDGWDDLSVPLAGFSILFLVNIYG